MKKSNVKSFLTGLLIGSLVFSSIAVAFAANHTESLQAFYRDIKVYVNGEQIDYTASNGAYAEPYIVDGTTYVPLRLFSEKTGNTVDWDEATSSIYVNDKEHALSFEDAIRLAYEFAMEKRDYSADEDATYTVDVANAEKMDESDNAYLIGLPVIAKDRVTGEDLSGWVDAFWVKKATSEVKYVDGFQDFEPGWVDMKTGEKTIK